MWKHFKFSQYLHQEKKNNKAQVIEEVQCTEKKEECERDSAISEDTPVEDYPIENIMAFFEVTEVHTHLPQYSEDCQNLINIQDARMCRTKPSRGKEYTAGASSIKSILMNDIEAKVNLDTGAFCTCVGKDYSQTKLPVTMLSAIAQQRCNSHPSGVRVFIHTPTQTPQIRKSSILISSQFQQSSF
ncbi:hypothetical protein O181_129240 [Austropuccinia psidii MF-1]|uniref:Uncharacterized protein n=1 Tax=Austropuccinia psidii MF-1 TaxID=1389203 RepID=A0A9Q3L1L9_9BASI|nr:hypothetical protein [Austropuccinia psidii MF-1]